MSNTPLREEASIEDRLSAMESQLDRIERMLLGQHQPLQLVPGGLAAAVDTFDDTIARLEARGVDVEERLPKVLSVVESITAPERLEALERITESLPRIEQTLTLAQEAVPGGIAAAMDTFDGIVLKLQAQGVDIEERLPKLLKVLETATSPEQLDALSRLTESLPELERTLTLARDTIPGGIAAAVDTFDDIVARMRAHGIDVEERAIALLRVADVATAPEHLAVLEDLLGNPQQLEQLKHMIQQAPSLVSMGVDIFDSTMDRLVDAGIEPERALHSALSALGKFTRLMQSEEFDAMLSSGMLAPETLRLLSGLGDALKETGAAPAERVGLFGALGASRRPAVQRALAFGLRFAEAFGDRLDLPRRQLGHER